MSDTAGGSPPDDRPVERVFPGRPAAVIVPAIATVVSVATVPAAAAVAAAPARVAAPAAEAATVATARVRETAPAGVARVAAPARVTTAGWAMAIPARVPRVAVRHARTARNVAPARSAGPPAVHRLGGRGPAQCQACQTHPRQQRHRADQVSCACGHDVLPTLRCDVFRSPAVRSAAVNPSLRPTRPLPSQGLSGCWSRPDGVPEKIPSATAPLCGRVPASSVPCGASGAGGRGNANPAATVLTTAAGALPARRRSPRGSRRVPASR